MSDTRDDWLDKLLKKASQSEPVANSTATPNPSLVEDPQRKTPYQKGDMIGRDYQVRGVLGQGGFGVVYLVYGRGGVLALKTFRDEFLMDQEVRKRFRKEASIWVELGRHPYLVQAHFVDELSGRLYIGMEYIAPSEAGLNSLDGYLQQQPPNLEQSLRWAIQICYGMEYAYSKGVRAHRDLKPANIMITRDKTAKITDFGIAGISHETQTMGMAGSATEQGLSGLSGQTVIGTGFGTPAYMPPEQFDDAAGCDERSDIYSFGIVLYQMVTGGRLPFTPSRADSSEQVMADFCRLHHEASVPTLDSPLFPAIERCLEKLPSDRYQSFGEARESLEALLQRQTGEAVMRPQVRELDVGGWNNKGASLANLGRYEDAIHCLDKALELDPHYAGAWDNKGGCLELLGRHEEAIVCFEEALRLDPQRAGAWNHKGMSLDSLGRSERAILCYDKALELDPRETTAWINKAVTLENLGRWDEAILCHDKALELDPLQTTALTNKGNDLKSLGRHEEAIGCYNEVLAVDPVSVDAWIGKGDALEDLGHHEEAVLCYEKALELDPHLMVSWNNKGQSLRSLGRYEESLVCIDKAIELDSRSIAVWNNKVESLRCLNRYFDAARCFDRILELEPRRVRAWYGKGQNLQDLNCYEESIVCFDKTLQLDPGFFRAWLSKALSEDALRRWPEAVECYRQFLTCAAGQDGTQVEFARNRLRELESRAPRQS